MLRTRPRLSFSRPTPVAASDRRRRSRHTVAASIAAFVALTAGLSLAAESGPYLRDPMYADKFSRLAPLADRRPLVVMVGTSRAAFGFHGHHVEAEVQRTTGQTITAFNLGTPASGPVLHLLYVRRMLAAGVTPDLLLIEVLPSMIGDQPAGPLESLWVYGERLTAAEVATAEGYGFRNACDQWRAGRLLPWHTMRFQLVGRVVQSWLPWHLRHDASRGTDARGWGTPQKLTATAEERAAGETRARDEYGDVLASLQPGGPAVAALRELLAECRRRNIPARLVWMPEAASFRRLYRPWVEPRVTGLLTELDPTWIDARNWAPDDGFTDGHHLLTPGAEAFSARLAAEVISPWAKGGER